MIIMVIFLKLIFLLDVLFMNYDCGMGIGVIKTLRDESKIVLLRIYGLFQ